MMGQASFLLFVFFMLGVVLALSRIASAPARSRAAVEFRVRVLEVLAAAVRRGLPLGPALAAAAEEHGGVRRAALRTIRRALERGAPLSEAFERAAGGFFPASIVAAVRAAEGEGDLAGALEAVAAETDAIRLALRRRAYILLAYPVGVLTLVAFVEVLARPAFVRILEGLGAEEYAGLRFAGDVLARLVFLAIAVGAFAILWRTVAGGSARVAALTEHVIARAPVAGPSLLLGASERLCRTLAPLVRAGLPLERALRRVAAASGCAPVARSVEAAAAAIEGGADPEAALAAIRAPRFVVVRLGAALAGGPARLAAALEGLAADCADRARTRAEAVATLIYPAVVVVVGAIVAVEFRTIFGALGGIVKRGLLW